MRILVVEDEKHLAAALRRGLTREGFAVDIASDGTEGLWMAQEGTYDAIVLDIMLPGLNGDNVCAQLREEGNWTSILMLNRQGRRVRPRRGPGHRRRRLPRQAILLRRADGAPARPHATPVGPAANLEGEPSITDLRARGGRPAKTNLRHLPIGEEGEEFRVVAQPAPSPAGPLTVYVASSLGATGESVAAVRSILLVGVALLLLVMGATTWVMVGWALGPVEAIRADGGAGG